jgi:hypothetical protein
MLARAQASAAATKTLRNDRRQGPKVKCLPLTLNSKRQKPFRLLPKTQLIVSVLYFAAGALLLTRFGP